VNTAVVLSPGVTEAVGELEDFCSEEVALEPDGSGGAYVTIPIDLGPSWSASAAPLTFHLSFNYPAASPYPYYLPGSLSLAGPWPPALQRIQWRDRNVIQVSLRHNNWDPHLDRVLGCILQVKEWLQR
jgi:hypothetical protein